MYLDSVIWLSTLPGNLEQRHKPSSTEIPGGRPDDKKVEKIEVEISDGREEC